MSKSKVFPWAECEEVPVKRFLPEFAFAINKIVPPEIVRKYYETPMNVIYTSMEEISEQLLPCDTIEDMHTTFMSLSDHEKHYVVQQLVIMFIEFENAVPEDTLLLVPEDRSDWIKPFFAQKLNLYDLLVD